MTFLGQVIHDVLRRRNTIDSLGARDTFYLNTSRQLVLNHKTVVNLTSFVSMLEWFSDILTCAFRES